MDILQMSGSYRKWIRRLHRRKFREEKGVFIAEGFNALEAAIETTCHPILEVVADEDHLESIVDILPEENIGVTSSFLRAPIKTGKKQGLKVSYDEGLAIHISPESCAGNGNIAGEALTRESAG